MNLSNKTLVKVQFRFVLGEQNSTNISKLFFVYVQPWSQLMKHVLSWKSDDIYADLPEMRKVIKKDFRVMDVLPYAQYFNPDELKMLIAAQPLFNIAPVDLKAYILAILGLKSHHVSSIQHDTLPTA